MTIRHLRIFNAVYEEMSITKAAKKLFLAQPSVSLAIRELEEHYGVRLFERINRRLFITEKGKELYWYSSHIMGIYKEMELNLKSEQLQKKISLGSSITIGNYVVPKLVSEFQKEYSKCKVVVDIKNSEQIVQAVAVNELDIGLVEGRVENEQLIKVPFMKDQLYFVSGKDHPLAKKRDVSLEDICKFPLYLRESGSASREITEGLLKSYEMVPDIAWESVSNQALLWAIKYNDGITVMPGKIIEKDAAEKNIYILPYYPDAFSRDFILIYHKKKYITPELQKIIAMVRNGIS